MESAIAGFVEEALDASTSKTRLLFCLHKYVAPFLNLRNFNSKHRIASELEDAEAKYLDDVEDPYIDKRYGIVLWVRLEALYLQFIEHDIGQLLLDITENEIFIDRV